MKVPAWTLALSAGSLVALFLLAGLAVGWWLAIAIYVPAVVICSVAVIPTHRFSATPSY
jgi:hypothetical protein